MLSAAQLRHLDEPAPVRADAVAAFLRDGHVVARGLLDPSVVHTIRALVMAAVARSGRLEIPEQRLRDAYARAFVQVVNASFEDLALQPVRQSARLGAWTAALLGAAGVRLFLEDIFLKQPGAGPTPWHQDASVAPVEVERMITAWIPLQRVSPEMGGLKVLTGTHRMGILGPVDITEASEAAFNRLIEERGLTVRALPTLEAGDVCFHAGLTVHGAAANNSDKPRAALALHCFADGALVTPVRNPNQAELLARFAPGLAPGDRAEGPLWPKLYP